MINIEKICPCIKDEDIELSITKEGGTILELDSKGIINNIEIEKLD